MRFYGFGSTLVVSVVHSLLVEKNVELSYVNVSVHAMCMYTFEYCIGWDWVGLGNGMHAIAIEVAVAITYAIGGRASESIYVYSS